MPTLTPNNRMPNLDQQDLRELEANLSGCEIRLNWYSYFQEFDAAHGGSPVEFEGRLLYRDGWQYSKSDYAGPEWRPPVDDIPRLRFMLLSYWGKRRAMIRPRLFNFEKEIASIREAQRDRPIPLKMSVHHQDESGKIIHETVDVSIADLERDLSYMREDLEECNAHIRKILGKAKGEDVTDGLL